MKIPYIQLRIIHSITMLSVLYSGVAAQQQDDSRLPQNTNNPASVDTDSKDTITEQANGLYASIKTNKGIVIATLYFTQTPLTVINFVGLAEGLFDTSPVLTKRGKYYNSLSFFRVKPNFLIYTGDINNNGTGGPGYTFPDETNNTVSHNRAGILSMERPIAHFNGSQFVITLAPIPSRDKKNTVFGSIVKGMDILGTITEKDYIIDINILTKGTQAENFLNTISWEIFNEQKQSQQTTLKRNRDALIANTIKEIKKSHPQFLETEDGIFYQYKDKPQNDDTNTNATIHSNPPSKTASNKNDLYAIAGNSVTIHYTVKIYAPNSKVIDSSYSREEPFTFTLGDTSVISGWNHVVALIQEGQKIHAIIPPNLAYGENGVGAVIPPNAFLDCEIKLLTIKR